MAQIQLLGTTRAAPIGSARYARIGPSAGGPPPPRVPWATAPAILGAPVPTRAPQDLNDRLIKRERMPWLHQTTMIPPGNGWFDWTASGPRRAPLHMRDVTIIEHTQGSSNTRNQDPNPTGYGTNDGTNQGRLSGNGLIHGLHTRPVQGVAPGVNLKRLLAGSPQMRPGRQNRLSDSRNSGQSYSQTTLQQGASK